MTTQTKDSVYDPELAFLAEVESIELPEEDDQNMESPWHRLAMNLLIHLLTSFWRSRTDFYVGGNMFIHFDLETVRKRSFRGPDFFVVKNVDSQQDRTSWVIWQEGGRYPDMILELLSPSTAEYDKNEKRRFYQNVFRTPEYFCYDPNHQELLGWALSERGKYQPLELNENGHLWSNELQLWLGTWSGEYENTNSTWLRFYDPNGNLIPTQLEASETELHRLQTELEKLRTEKNR